jgi:hypothetical protein
MTEILTEEEIKQMLPYAQVAYNPDLRTNITERDIELTQKFLKRLNYNAQNLESYPELKSGWKSEEDLTYFVKCLEIRKKIEKRGEKPREKLPDASWRDTFKGYLDQLDLIGRPLAKRDIEKLMPKGGAGTHGAQAAAADSASRKR